MKRSEVIILIAEILMEEVEDAQFLATYILNSLEHIGMLPPLREKIESERFVGFSTVNHPSWDQE